MLPAADLLSFALPAILVALGALLCLVAEPFLTREGKHSILPWTGIGFLALAGVALSQSHPGHLYGMFALDPVRAGLVAILFAVAALGLSGVQRNLRSDAFAGGEPYALMLLATFGVMGMILATDSVALFVCMELTSLSIYPMVGLRRHRLESSESLLKYYVLGAVFSAIFLYGASLVYGATGSTAYVGRIQEGREVLYLLGFILMTVGLLFKVGAFPFHFWSPDAYTGAPSGVTAFMAGAVKLGAFAALGATWLGFLLSHALTPAGMTPSSPIPLGFGIDPMLQMQLGQNDGFGNMIQTGFNVGIVLFALLGLLSILIGSLSVLRQTSVRRLVAFSGVANAGFLLIGLMLPSLRLGYVALDSVWLYLAGYAISVAGAMAAISALTGTEDNGDNLSSLAGAGRRQPLMGAALTVFLASLAGLPPAVGFIAKFQVMSQLILNASGGWLLAIPVAVMGLAIVAATAYFRLGIALWAQPTPSETEEKSIPALLGWTVSLAALAVLALGVFPKILF